jgi:hypothetical protein
MPPREKSPVSPAVSHSLAGQASYPLTFSMKMAVLKLILIIVNDGPSGGVWRGT